MRTHFGAQFGFRNIVGTVCVAVAALASSPVFAWKPQTHMYAANKAIGLIMSDVDLVNINGKNYQVIPQVAAAIRAFPQFYRAGVCGPDAFPDIYVGQGFIHPDTRNNNGRDPNTLGDGHSYTYEWLRHIYQAGWSYYNSKGGNASGQKILAFTYGFLTHAAGDMWAHTFVNDYARGVFPDVFDVVELPIAARHIVVESYIGDATPATDLTLVQGSDELADFTKWAMMKHEAVGGFVDSAGFDAKELGRGKMYDFFYELRADVQSVADYIWSEDGAWLWVLDPITTGIFYLAMLDWVNDIDDGLEAWAYMSQDISVDLFTNGSFSDALDRATDFITDHLTHMLGVPDGTAVLLDLLVDILSLMGDAIAPLKDYLLEFANSMVSQAYGIDIMDTIDYNTHPANHINSFVLGFAPDTSNQLNAAMNRTDAGDPFDPNAFAPMFNTIQTSKLILLSPEAMNEVLYDNRVGALYSQSSSTDNENVMLGFIRTLDGHQQWRENTAVGYSNNPFGAKMGEGMLIWSDCLARDRVFKTLFKDWQNGGSQFPDLGEARDHISDTTPPASTLAVNGATVTVNGIQYVGNTTTFTVTGTPNHFWTSNEIKTNGQYLPLGSLQTGTSTVNFGPIDGPDGAYSLKYQGIGICGDQVGYPGTLNSKSVTLDGTPPTITVAPPAQNQWMDVNNTLIFDMNATDAGSGVQTITATLDGQPILDGATIDAFFLTAGQHTIVVTATDKIGNQSTLTRLFEVHATIQGLKAAVTRAYSLGLITKPTTQTALQQQLDAALKAFNKGDKANAANKIASAKQLVEGQLGSGVQTAFGQRFISWCNDLIQRLNTP